MQGIGRTTRCGECVRLGVLHSAFHRDGKPGGEAIAGADGVHCFDLGRGDAPEVVAVERDCPFSALGDDDLPGYWTMGVNGQRWSYYRLNSLSHNVPLLGNQNQYPLAKAQFSQVELNTATPFAILNLTEAYRDLASKSTRKVSLINQRSAFLIEDEFVLTKNTEVAWGMMTANSIEVQKGGKAILRNATITTRTLEAEVVSPQGAEFSVESAVQKAPEKLNTGHSRLMLRLPNQTGTVKVIVKLTPKG